MQKKQFHYAWLIMISCIAIAITGLGIINGCTGIFLLPVSKELGVGIGDVSLYITIQTLTMSLLMPIAAKIMQKFNLRIILTSAFIIQCGCFMLLSRLSSVIQLYIIGAVIGVASSFIVYLAIPTLMNAWFKKNLGTVLGITLAFSGVSGAIFNPLGNYFILNYGWRNTYLLMGAIGAVIVLPFMTFVVRGKPSDKGLQPYGANEVTEKDIQKNELFGISAASAVKTGAFYLALFAMICFSFVGYIVFHLPGYIVGIGFSSMIAAVCVSVLMIGVIIGKILIGFLTDKVGIIGASNFIGILSGIGALIMMLHIGGTAMLVGGAFLLGLGGAGITVLPPLLVQKLFGQKDYTTIYSYLSMGVSFVGAFIVSIYGFIYDFTGSYVYDFAIILVAIVLAIINITFSVKSVKYMNSKIKSYDNS